MRPPTWTDAQVAKLIKLWNSGQSSIDIGQAFAVSKSAVVGKVNRLRDAGHYMRAGHSTQSRTGSKPDGRRTRLKEREARRELFGAPVKAKRVPKPPKHIPTPKPEPAPKMSGFKFVAKRASDEHIESVAAKGMRFLEHVDASLSGTGVTIDELKRLSCRAVTTKSSAPVTLFCGETKAPGSNWCEGCRRTMTVRSHAA